jgi:hypothetical protein
LIEVGTSYKFTIGIAKPASPNYNLGFCDGVLFHKCAVHFWGAKFTFANSEIELPNSDFQFVLVFCEYDEM